MNRDKKICRSNDVRYMIGLLHVANVFGLCPRYARKTNKFVAKWPQIAISVILFSAILTAYIFTMALKAKHQAHLFPAIVFTVRVMSESVTVATVLVCIYSGSFLKLRSWNRLWNNLKSLDRLLHQPFSRRLHWKYYAENSMMFLYTCGTMVYGFTIMFQLGAYIQALHFVISNEISFWPLVSFNFISSLKYRFTELHGALERRERIDPKYIKTVYSRLSESVKVMNDIFGLPMLLMITNIMLLCFVSIMRYFPSKNGQESSQPVNKEAFISLVLYAAIVVMTPMLITLLLKVCNDAAEEYNKTSFKVCQFVVESQLDGVDLKKLKDLYFVMEMGRRNLHFSAAGYFIVDHTLVFSFISVLISFTIMSSSW